MGFELSVWLSVLTLSVIVSMFDQSLKDGLSDWLIIMSVWMSVSHYTS